MTAPETDAEREVDLARWRRAVVALWWLPVAGLVVGAILGAVLLDPRGQHLHRDRTDLARAADLARRRARAELRHEPASRVADRQRRRLPVSRRQMPPTCGRQRFAGTSPSERWDPPVPVQRARRRSSRSRVTGTHPARTSRSPWRNKLADIVVAKTTASYVKTKIKTFQTTLDNVKLQLAGITTQLNVINKALAAAKRLDPFQQLVIVGQQNNAETRQGNLIAQEETLQQQLVFAQQVEARAQIVEKAGAIKASAHSRSSSILIGALIGLILGAIVAVAGESRLRRA